MAARTSGSTAAGIDRLPTRLAPAAAAALGLFLLAAACGPGEAAFTTRFASGFVPENHAVSIFGVFRDGQMSTESWGTIGSRVSPSLGAPRCEAAYAEPFVSTRSSLWAAIEDYARANGPTDDLLAQLAPAANGDLILVFTVAGRVPERKKSAGASDPGPPPTSMGRGGMGGGRGGLGGGGGYGGGGAGRPSAPALGASGDALDLSVSLFSVADGHSVGLVALEYSGGSADDAITQFAAKLSQVLHGTRCVGWNWDAKIDPERLRHLDEIK